MSQSLLETTPVLCKIFGEEFLNKFFTTDKDGLSSSSANSIKNDNTNKSRELLGVFQNFSVYKEKLTVLSTNIVEKETIPQMIYITDFGNIESVAKMFGENAVLGHGINLRNRLEKLILGYSDTEWGDFLGLEIPIRIEYNYERKFVTRNSVNINKFLELDRLEELLEGVIPEILNEFSSEDILEALRLEAWLAVWGNQLTSKNSPLNLIVESPRNKGVEKSESSFGLILKEFVKNYDEDDVDNFSTLREKLYNDYSNNQKKLNGFKKLLKDKIREKQLIFDNEAEESRKKISADHENYLNKVAEITAKINVARTTAIKELAALKIKNS